MRTAQLKINGKTVEGVLMSGGFGAQVYSVSGVKGVVLKTGRSTHVIHEDTPAFKTVMRFVNMKYQAVSEHDGILQEFRGLVKELQGEKKSKNPMTLPSLVPPYIVVYDKNDKHYYLTTYPEAQLEHLKTNEKKRSYRISERGDSEETTFPPTPKFYQESWNERVKQDFKSMGLQILGDFEADDYLPLAVIQEIAGLLNPEFEREEREMAKVKNPNILTRQAHKKSKPYSEMSLNELLNQKIHNIELMKSYPTNSNLYKSAYKHLSEIIRELKKFPLGKRSNPTKLFSDMTREELEAEKRAALSLLKTFTRGSALYEDTMRDLGKINRELKSLGEPSMLAEFAKKKNPVKRKHLHLWERPSNYAGPDWSDYYVLFVKSRDDDSYNLLNISNFDVALDRLGGESEDNGVLVIRDSHWAVGWIEYILVHKDSKKVKIAEEIMEAYHQYPVLDDSHFSEVEHEAVMETYTNYKEDFLKELLAYVGDERDVSALKGKELEEADIVLQYVIEESASGSGAENAWITEREIKHWIHGQHEYFYDKKNRWFKKLLKAEGL